MSRRREAAAVIPAAPGDLFARLDDQGRLAEHMTRASAMTAGARMSYEFDAAKGRAVGSRIVMRGAVCGFELYVEEVVTVREPPLRKAWRTVGAPRLVVMGGYAMGFDIAPDPGGARLTVWIEYDPPPRGIGRFAPALADVYADWCVQRMVADAKHAFAPASGPRALQPAA